MLSGVVGNRVFASVRINRPGHASVFVSRYILVEVCPVLLSFSLDICAWARNAEHESKKEGEGTLAIAPRQRSSIARVWRYSQHGAVLGISLIVENAKKGSSGSRTF